MQRIIACTLAALLLTSCAPGRDLAEATDPVTTEYRLGVDDQVRIITFGEDQLTGTFRISDGGNVDIPLLGSVHAQGLTSRQLAAAITAELKRKQLLRNPSIAVEVSQYRPIFILGEVKNPGQYPYEPGMTMLTAVSVAGGFTYRGIKDYGSVVRTQNARPEELRIARQGVIQPGDVITIYERLF